MSYRPQVKTANGVNDLPLDAETVKGSDIVDSSGKIKSTKIPDLDASKITSGTIAPERLGTPQYVDGTHREVTCSPNETTWWKITNSQLPTIPSGHILLRYEAVCDNSEDGECGLGGMGYNGYFGFHYISTINAGNTNRTFNIWIRAWYL